MKLLFLVPILFVLSFSKTENERKDVSDSIIADGQMPNVAVDRNQNIHLVFGHGDSILYSYSGDHGQTFSKPALVSLLKNLTASHMRGPQIAATTNGVIITACNQSGNIFSYRKVTGNNWSKATRVNDVDTIARENFMALSSDGDKAFAVWLDLRNKHNQIFGSSSIDGGKTWSKNIQVYASPDKTVCECCKPSVVVKQNNVYIMFRNWLHGNRDLYLIRSSDFGKSFEKAQKLGNGSWALNACPMDGGGIAVDENGNVKTVWRREGDVYFCSPGNAEVKLGNGRGCTVETVNGKSVYAWVEKGNVVVLKPQDEKVSVGGGQLPIIKAIGNKQILCVWENEEQVHRAIVGL
jgi:hypothetical protein